MGLSGPRVAARKIISVGVVYATNGTIIESDIVNAWGLRGSAVGDFLTGIRWGAWFFLAAIVAAGLWAIVH